MAKRGSTFAAVGADVPGAQMTIRYDGDDDAEVAALTEVVVAELIAATWWSAIG